MSDQTGAPAQDVMGVPSEDQAYAATAAKTEDGSEVSEGQRKQFAERIEQAARANGSWRSTLPVEQQLALANVPTVSIPPVEPEPDSQLPLGETDHASV